MYETDNKFGYNITFDSGLYQQALNSYIDQLEKALDKACKELSSHTVECDLVQCPFNCEYDSCQPPVITVLLQIFYSRFPFLNRTSSGDIDLLRGIDHDVRLILHSTKECDLHIFSHHDIFILLYG